MDARNAVYDFLKIAPVQQQGHNVVVSLDSVPNVEVGVQVGGSVGIYQEPTATRRERDSHEAKHDEDPHHPHG
jgi:hypothetical protein